MPIAAPSPLTRLPLVTLYVTERCNSRCVTCDYWRHGRNDMNLHAVTRLLPSLKALQTQVVLLSGGEPLMNPEWAQIAEVLRAHGLKVWLLTSGLSLAKHARRAAGLFDDITVSLDGADAAAYAAIRGLDAFDKVCDGIRAVAHYGRAAGIRVTLQRANYHQMPRLVDLAQQMRARFISFLAVDVANPHAFGRAGGFASDLGLQAEELTEFDAILRMLESDYRADFLSGFIAESPEKLRRILQYFAALTGHARFPDVRCNAPEFSAVIGTDGRVQPCFFISGPRGAELSLGADGATGLPQILNRGDMAAQRAQIRARAREECRTCVCSLWREPAHLHNAPAFTSPGPEAAA